MASRSTVTPGTFPPGSPPGPPPLPPDFDDDKEYTLGSHQHDHLEKRTIASTASSVIVDDREEGKIDLISTMSLDHKFRVVDCDQLISLADQRSNHPFTQDDTPATRNIHPSLPGETTARDEDTTDVDFSKPEPNALALLPDDSFWADICGMPLPEISSIGDAYDLHPLTIEDMGSDITGRVKFDSFRTYLFISVKCCGESVDDDFPLLHIVLMKKCVLTIHTHRIAAVTRTKQRFAKEIARQRSKSSSGDTWRDLLSSDWVLYFLLDSITDDYVRMTNVLVGEADTIEELMSSVKARDRLEMLQRINNARFNTRVVTQHLSAKLDILRRLCGSPSADSAISGVLEPEQLVRSHTRKYMTDVMDHAMESVNLLGITDHALESSASIYLAHASIDMAEISNGMADQMTLLSLVATVMLPLSLVAGLFGMNVKVPFGDVDSLVPFYTICGGMVLFFVAIMVWEMKSKKNND